LTVDRNLRNVPCFQDLFVAGTDTNSLTVEWTMAELLRHPAIMSKVRAELQQVIGSKQYPDESHISSLTYLRTVVMETMRHHPPSPLLMPREAMEEGAEVGGFMVPKGAMVIVNLWAIMRDPATWSRPEEFVPERFIKADSDFRGMDRFDFMPFGAGRRACPGMPMATRAVMLILASLLHAFEWRLPEGMQPSDVDIRDRFGTSLNMVTPLKAVPVPLC
jgi:cytochrome P450